MVLYWLGFAVACSAAKTPASHVRVELVAEQASAQPGGAFPVAVRLEMKDGWHTYWRNPGESGMATDARWKLPAGWSASELRWPAPRRFTASGSTSFGFGDEAILLAELKAPASARADAVAEISATVRWLECKETCVPGKAQLSLRVPIRAQVPLPNDSAKAVFERGRARLPKPPRDKTVTAERAAGVIRLRFWPRAGDAGPAEFFPYDAKTIDGAKPQPIGVEGEFLTLDLTPSRLTEADAAPRLSGVLSFEGRGEAFEISIPIERSKTKKGRPAPDFTLTDSRGKAHALSAYKDKVVVLEWLNFDCPFSKKHYRTGNMQALQAAYAAKGVVWLSIISSALGRQGDYPAAEINRIDKERGGHAAAILLDPKGTAGHLYAAKTTPHMFVIDKGRIAYEGAIDDHPTADVEDIPRSRNYVKEALDAVLAGKPVKESATTPYGCSVKYAD